MSKGAVNDWQRIAGVIGRIPRLEREP